MRLLLKLLVVSNFICVVAFSQSNILSDNFLLESRTRFLWEEDSWVNDMMLTYNYNDQNIETDHYSYFYQENEWRVRSHILRSYDENGNDIEYLEMRLQDTAWINFIRYVKNYDDHNNLFYFEYQYWDDSLWVVGNRNNRIFDENNNLIEEISERYRDNKWENYFKINYSYENTQKTESILMLWRDSNWVNSSRRSYGYDENDLLTAEYYDQWEENNWEKYRQTTYTYSENMNLINSLEQLWSGDAWDNNELTTYIYDSNFNNTEMIIQEWVDNQWINYYKEINSYTLATSIKSVDLLNIGMALSQNYPNPFNPTTTIKYTIPNDERRETKNVKLIVFDLLGREVVVLVNEKKRPGKYEVRFDVSNVNKQISSGLYFYRLTTEDFTESRKMILLK